MLKTLFRYLSAFGPYWTARVYVLPTLRSLASGESVAVLSQKQVKEFVAKAIAPVIDKYQNAEAEDLKLIPEDCPIWVCWWQGEDRMPEISRRCIETIRQNRGKHPVILVTKDNYTEFVDLPEIFLERLNSGKMCFAHFADTLRVNLIKQNGGIWIDSSMWMLKPIDTGRQPFYTNKNQPNSKDYISNYRWTGGVLGASADMVLFNYLADCYERYWTSYPAPIDFMIMDYFIALGYENIPVIRQLIDNHPFNNPDFYSLKNRLNEAFDSDYFESICKRNDLLSLNRRSVAKDCDQDDRMTYWGYLKQLTDDFD